MADEKARLLAQAGGGESSGANAFSRAHSTRPAPKAQRPKHGNIVADTWQKTVRGSLHQLRKPKGWAVDVFDLDAAERCGALYVALHDLESLRWHWAAVATIRQKGWPLDRGFGRQVALGLEHWRPTRETAEADAPKPAGVQLSLWVGDHGA